MPHKSDYQSRRFDGGAYPDETCYFHVNDSHTVCYIKNHTQHILFPGTVDDHFIGQDFFYQPDAKYHFITMEDDPFLEYMNNNCRKARNPFRYKVGQDVMLHESEYAIKVKLRFGGHKLLETYKQRDHAENVKEVSRPKGSLDNRNSRSQHRSGTSDPPKVRSESTESHSKERHRGSKERSRTHSATPSGREGRTGKRTSRFRNLFTW